MHHKTLYTLFMLLCFSILEEFNLQKLPNFLLHPSLFRITAEIMSLFISPLRLKAVKENENIENTEI